jgi:hypothetical protein
VVDRRFVSSQLGVGCRPGHHSTRENLFLTRQHSSLFLSLSLSLILHLLHLNNAITPSRENEHNYHAQPPFILQRIANKGTLNVENYYDSRRKNFSMKMLYIMRVSNTYRGECYARRDGFILYKGRWELPGEGDGLQI